MQKRIGLIGIVAIGVAVMSFSVAAAQDKVVLKLGEFLNGEITQKVHEVSYSFSAKKGDVITLEIMPDPTQPDLDPTIELRNSDGQTLAKNDDFNYPLALAIAELPADGDYIAVAGRSGGEEGDSTGKYRMRVSVAQLVDSGSTIDATISSDLDAPAQIFILRPAKSGPMDITMSQEIGDNYAELRVLTWADDSYPDTLVNIDNTSKLSKATLTVNVEANSFYVLKLQQTAYNFGDPVDFPVKLELK